MRIASSLVTAVALTVSGTGLAAAQPIPSGSALLQPAWPLPTDVEAAVHAAGLTLSHTIMTTYHYHVHLDVIVYGQHVTVPASVGIDEARKMGSPLHTHDTSGIVHIESGEDIPFTLGQFFTEWGQPLTSDRVGPIQLTPLETVQLYVNGTRYEGDPAAYRFVHHDQVALVVGTRWMTPAVPSSYEFPPGL
ncbi:hypothetical protein [Nocardia cyriacigeorgica]|uniref:hypothetical protein n=1 Tax=Nocardia cyriacigeorgica TaxID=135487 RepID=UPI0013D73310|nr:hypothetical protein [Nocardia cyriacigeorgica]NEW27209.1 hypothetical protein [Nocardia cyriacigeorgica]